MGENIVFIFEPFESEVLEDYLVEMSSRVFPSFWNSEINLCVYGQMILKRMPRLHNEERRVSSTNGAWILTCKRLMLDHIQKLTQNGINS